MSEYCDQHHLMSDMATKVNEMHICLLGDPKSEKAGGLRAVVDRHDSVIASIKRVIWIVIGTCVTAFVAMVIKGGG